MKKLLAIALVSIFILILKSYFIEAQEIPAYIDWVSGVVIGRGEAAAKEGVSTSQARQQAIDEAKKNILIVLERQNIEIKDKENRTQYTTIGKYLASHPEKKHLINQFLDTAAVINETAKKDGAVKVTISLPVEGDSGLRALMNWLEGKQESPPSMTASAHENITTAQVTDAAISLPDKVLQKIAEPYSIALFTFENLTDYQAVDLGSEFVQRLKNQFKRDRRFIFLSPGESRKILEKNKTTEEKLKDSDITETMPIEGTDGLVLGSITRYEPEIKKHGIGGAGYLEIKFHMTLDVQILDARSGKWVFYEEIPITVEDRTFTLKSADDADKFILMNDLDSEHGLAAKAVKTLLATVEENIRTIFPLEGYVLKVLGDRVYINLTRSDGLKKDDALTVFRMGEILTDPLTGREIDRIKDSIGTIRVVDVKDTYTQAIVEEVLQPIREGDIVSF